MVLFYPLDIRPHLLVQGLLTSRVTSLGPFVFLLLARLPIFLVFGSPNHLYSRLWAATTDDDGKVEFVAGNMMGFIPPADAVLLKRCREAISTRKPKGKVIIIDTVIGSTAAKQTLEAQLLMDLMMMVLVTGKGREEEQWSRMFHGCRVYSVQDQSHLEASFTN
ncbi:hypothetical protein EJB05_02521, partial [Eragrostis curvula]